jgi:hypothetical protein
MEECFVSNLKHIFVEIVTSFHERWNVARIQELTIVFLLQESKFAAAEKFHRRFQTAGKTKWHRTEGMHERNYQSKYVQLLQYWQDMLPNATKCFKFNTYLHGIQSELLTVMTGKRTRVGLSAQEDSKRVTPWFNLFTVLSGECDELITHET